MARLLALLLILAGLHVVTAPAHAGVHVTINAGRTSFPAGESTAIRGKAIGAKRGSVVKLQRRVSGAWKTLRKKRVWSTRRYRFRVSPRRGYHRFRVKKAWHRGQPPAVSSTLKLAVLKVSIRAERTLMHGDSTRIKGKAFGAARGSVVKLQRRANGSWKTLRKKRVWSTRRYSFGISPPRGYQRYRVVKPWQDGQPRVVSPVRQLSVQWRPVISVSAAGQVDPASDLWVTTVSGTAPGLRGTTLAVQRYTDGVWAATGETLAVEADGTFAHVITGGAKGTRYRYASPASALRLPAWSPAVTVAAEVYTPTVTVTVSPVQHDSGTVDWPEYHQEQQVSIATNAPDAPVTVEILAYFDYSDRWMWQPYRRGTTLADGSFTTVLRNLPEGTRVRAVVAASDDGARKQATSPEAVTTLTPIPVTIDGPQVDIFDITRDRGTLLRFEAVAGEPLTFDFADAYRPAGTTVSWRLLGPDGSEVPEQRFVRDRYDEHVNLFYVPTQTGTHTFVLSSSRSTSWPAGEDARVTLSSPKEVPFNFDIAREIVSKRPWQVVDLKLTATAGQMFSLYPQDIGSSCPSAQVIQDGQVVNRLLPQTPTSPMHPSLQGAWRLPADGPFVVRLWPCDREYWKNDSFWEEGFQHTLAVIRARTATLPFGPHSTRIDQMPGQYAVLDLPTTAGKVIRVTKEERSDWVDTAIEAPDGSVVYATATGVPGQFEFTATQSGTYKLWVSPPEDGAGYVVWSATERNN